jgi:hypothetical protein
MGNIAMPQSIEFSDSPSEDAQKLSEIIDGLLQFGMIHESIIDEISSVLCNIYANELHQLLIEEGAITEDEELDLEIHSAGPIYLMTFVDDKRQFVEDYRNTILVMLWPESFDTADVANQVISLRSQT